MLNKDKIKINNILIAINNQPLSVFEVEKLDEIYLEYKIEKDYYDACLLVLTLRNATNSVLQDFYNLAKENSIEYEAKKTKSSEVFIIGGANV